MPLPNRLAVSVTARSTSRVFLVRLLTKTSVRVGDEVLHALPEARGDGHAVIKGDVYVAAVFVEAATQDVYRLRNLRQGGDDKGRRQKVGAVKGWEFYVHDVHGLPFITAV